MKTSTSYGFMYDDGINQYMIVDHKHLTLGHAPSYKCLFLSETSAKPILKRITRRLHSAWTSTISIDGDDKHYIPASQAHHQYYQNRSDIVVNDNLFNPLYYKVVPITLAA